MLPLPHAYLYLLHCRWPRMRLHLHVRIHAPVFTAFAPTHACAHPSFLVCRSEIAAIQAGAERRRRKALSITAVVGITCCSALQVTAAAESNPVQPSNPAAGSKLSGGPALAPQCFVDEVDALVPTRKAPGSVRRCVCAHAVLFRNSPRWRDKFLMWCCWMRRLR